MWPVFHGDVSLQKTDRDALKSCVNALRKLALQLEYQDHRGLVTSTLPDSFMNEESIRTSVERMQLTVFRVMCKLPRICVKNYKTFFAVLLINARLLNESEAL